MAEVQESVEQVVAEVNEQLNATLNATVDTLESLTGVENADLFLAYFFLLIMAIVPIYIGSHMSLHERPAGEEKEAAMTTKDAAMFPFYASFFLFGLYMVFKIFGKEYINLLLTFYFLVLGVVSVGHAAAPIFSFFIYYIAESLLVPFHLFLSHGTGDDKSIYFDLKFNWADIVGLIFGVGVGAAYYLTKNWICNNLFGLAFCVFGIEQLQLGSYKVGCILLGGLFFYDIFWVFFTDVMVTVAKSFDAPIKLLFPKDLLSSGIIDAKQFTMLGLGDIVIPGVVIALLLRFDKSRATKEGQPVSKVYFYATYIAYILGLVTTIVVMHVFKHAQPALLYLVPACLGAPFLVALARGELGELFAYHDEEEEEQKQLEKKEN